MRAQQQQQFDSAAEVTSEGARGSVHIDRPRIDSELVSLLVRDGVPELAAMHAVYNTDGSGFEAARAWFYENIENQEIYMPLVLPPEAISAARPGDAIGADEEEKKEVEEVKAENDRRPSRRGWRALFSSFKSQSGASQGSQGEGGGVRQCQVGEAEARVGSAVYNYQNHQPANAGTDDGI